MIYSTKNIFIRELCLVLEDGKMSTAEWQPSSCSPWAIPPAQQSQSTSGLRLGEGSLDGEHQTLHQCCLYFHGQTIPHTPCPFLVKLFKAPPSQQNPTVANIAKWERMCTAENVSNVGEEGRVLGQHFSASWQERRTATATALQQILEVRGTSQKSSSQTRSPLPQTNVAAVLTLCLWAWQKISLHTAHSPPHTCTLTPVLSRSLIYTHSPSLSALCVSQETSR